MRPTMRWMAVAATALALVAGGCSDEDPVTTADDPPEVPDREPDLSGTITQVAPFEPVTEDCVPAEDVDPDEPVSDQDPPICTPDDNDVVGTILVEGDLAPEQGRKIVYTVTTSSSMAGSFADLAEGDQVDTWATGPCAESYPEQCTLEALRPLG